jgi:hypothetical protein
MAIDTAIPRSRRALLAGLVGGAAAALTATLMGAQRVLAAGDDGTPILVAGSYEDARSETVIANYTNDNAVFRAGSNQAGTGVHAFSTSGSGVHAESSSGSGIRAYSTSGTGVHGTSGSVEVSEGYPAAVLGEVAMPSGVSILGNNYATSGHAQGVQGTTSSPAGYATTGWATKSGTALVGVSGTTFPASSVPTKTGLYGYSQNGRGGVLQGKVSQLRLVPAAGAHPPSGQAGDLFMDQAHHLWLCRGGSTWKQLA